jgi:hypothetical protein
VELEKMMYKMNSVMLSGGKGAVEMFSKILESYLSLPLKLKPIFDKLKKYELIIGKFFKQDSSLFKDLS